MSNKLPTLEFLQESDQLRVGLECPTQTEVNYRTQEALPRESREQKGQFYEPTAPAGLVSNDFEKPKVGNPPDERDLTLLAETATGLVELPAEADPYEFVGASLERISGNVGVVIRSCDEATGKLVVRSVRGLAQAQDDTAEMFGIGLREIDLNSYPALVDALRSGRFIKLPNVVRNSAYYAIPDATTAELHHPLGPQNSWAIGFVRRGRLLGACSIIPGAETELPDAVVVETFARQAAATIERRRVEDQLRQANHALHMSEARFQAFVDTSSDIVYWTSADGTLKYIGPQIDRYGIDAAAAVERGFRSFIAPIDWGRVEEGMVQLLEGGVREPVEVRSIGSNGETHWFADYSTAIRDEAGNIIGVSGVLRDISEQKKAEGRARALRQQLIDTQKLASIGTLVSGISHEITNPNNVVLLDAEFLEHLIADLLPIADEHYQEHGDFAVGNLPYSEVRNIASQLPVEIFDSAVRIQKLIDNLRGISRDDGGRLTELVDINAVVSSAVIMAKQIVRKATDRFEVQTDAAVPLVRGNFLQLELVVINLLTNASRAIENRENGIEVATFSNDNGPVVVRVRDEGRGMDARTLSLVTDPFRAARHFGGANIGAGKGTGLELFLCDAIAKRCGGELIVNSSPGNGSSVELRLPPSTSAEDSSA